MVLMGLGSFRFSVSNFSFEQFEQSTGSRIAEQEVIGAAPRTHLLGPAGESIELSSTFFPFHLNTGGLQQLAGMRAACKGQSVMMLVSGNGNFYGQFVIKDIKQTRTYYHPNGEAQKIEVKISLLRYNGGGALGFALSLF